MALLSDPRLLVLDEPTTGMDVEGRRAFWGAIREDAERGRTVMFATHYLDEADAYADRIVLIRQGSVVADGTTAVATLDAARTTRAGRLGAGQLARLALTFEPVAAIAVEVRVEMDGEPFVIEVERE